MSISRVSNREVKKINRNQIYRLVNQLETTSKQEIAYKLGLSVPTVLQNINELIEEGLVKEVGEFESTGGRKAKAIAPIYEARYAVGVDITQNHLSIVLCNLKREVLSHTRIYCPFELTQAYMENMKRQISSFVEALDVPGERINGIGISLPGIVDYRENRLTSSHVLKIYDVDCEMFARYMDYPCVFVNDANAAGMAEVSKWEEDANVIYLSLSNSVGGAVLIGQKPYYGDHFRSGEFGHMTLVPGGKTCYCGKDGCFDAYCSARQLAVHAGGSLEEFFRLLPVQVELMDIWEKYLSNLSIQIHNLKMAYNCQVIVGGYVGSFMEPYMDTLREKVSRLDPFGDNKKHLRCCQYRVEASALGAALQCIDQYIEEI